jgi:hypothetical protein
MAHRISIPTPCQESWEKMSPTENGRFCAVCAHEVPDLTRTKDDELVALIQRQAFPSCARMLPGQLDRALGGQRELPLLAVAATLAIAPLVTAQDTAKTDQTTPDTTGSKEQAHGKKKRKRKWRPSRFEVEPLTIEHFVVGDVAIMPPPRTLIGFSVLEQHTPPECAPLTGVTFIPPADQQPGAYWEKETHEGTARLNAGPHPTTPPTPKPERAAGHAWAAVLFDRRVRIQALAGFRERLRALLPH